MSKAIVRFKLYFFFTNLFLSQKPFLGKFKISRCGLKKAPKLDSVTAQQILVTLTLAMTKQKTLQAAKILRQVIHFFHIKHW